MGRTTTGQGGQRTTRLLLVAGLAVIASGSVRADDARPSGGQVDGPLTERRSLVEDGATLTHSPAGQGRAYTEYATGARAEQLDPLHATVSIAFDDDVASVGDAAHRLLSNVGFTLLADGPNVSPLLEGLLRSPLPRMQREFHRVRVREILRALAGRGFVPVVDYLKRRVTMDPRPLYHRTGERPVPDGRGGERAWQKIGPGAAGSDGPLVPAVPMRAEDTPSGEGRAVDDAPGEWQAVGTFARQSRVRPTASHDADAGPTSSTDAPSFAERVKRRIDLTDDVASDPDALAVEIPPLVPGQRLGATNATALRRLARAFVAGRDVVHIADCGLGERSARHQRTLVHRVLEQHGLGDDAVSSGPCRDRSVDRATVVSLVRRDAR